VESSRHDVSYAAVAQWKHFSFSYTKQYPYGHTTNASGDSKPVSAVTTGYDPRLKL
jgi:hypothetical protein